MAVDFASTNLLLPLEFDWVEPDKQKAPPNHLVDTNIFSKLRGNNFVQAEPAELHFYIETNNKKNTHSYKKQLRIINVTAKATRINFIPPETKWFNLSYTIPTPFVPGSSINCTVIFQPDDTRYYEDFIRVHTEDQNNQLLIPLYGYPAIGDVHFPQFIRLPPVPLGRSVEHRIPLKCTSAVKFDFVLKKRRDHANFQVSPTKGQLQAGQSLDIMIHFTPTDYTTCRLDLELNVSQINFKPKRCSVIGWCQPGLDIQTCKEQFAHKYGLTDSQDAALFALTPLDRARQSKFQRELQNSVMVSKSREKKLTANKPEPEGKITCPYHVAKLLGKESRSLVRDSMNYTRRQQKVLAFEASIRQDAIEERRNQVRWHAKLGQQPICATKRAQLKSEWQMAWQSYLTQTTDLECLLQKPSVTYIRLAKSDMSTMENQRPHRPVHIISDLNSVIPRFRVERLPPTGWTKRWNELNRFRQIVAKLIIRKRLTNRLRKIKQSISNRSVENTGRFEQAESSIPEDIKIRLGYPIFHKPLDWTARKLPTSCEQQPIGTKTEVLDAKHPTDPSHQLAIDLIELTSSANTPPQSWPVFDLSPAWEWQLDGCEAFDSLEARDLALLAGDPKVLEVQWMTPLLESRLDLIRRDEEPTVTENNVTFIIPTDKRFPVGDPMSLTNSLLKPMKQGTKRDSVTTIPPLAIIPTPEDDFDPVANHVDTNARLPEALRDMNKTEGADPMEQLGGLPNIRSMLDKKNTATVLTEWTTHSAHYKPLVPLQQYCDVPANDLNETKAVLSEMRAAETLLGENKIGAEIAKGNLIQTLQEFAGKFPEITPIVQPWIPREEETVGLNPKTEELTDLACSPQEKSFTVSFEIETSIDQQTHTKFIQKAGDLKGEITSLCVGNAFSSHSSK